MDPLPEASSSTPAIAGAFAQITFAAVLGSAMFAAGLLTRETGTPVIARSPEYHHQHRASRDDLGFLRREWVDPDAVQVREETISGAKMLLAQLPVSVERPHLSVSAEGEIGFSWTNGVDRFEAMLDPEDHLVWVSKVGGIFSPGGDILISSAADRDVFYAALREFHGRA